MTKINAFILAAGLGERLRPITNQIPKPLVPVLGRPILERVLERVSTLPIKKIGVNLHYQKDLIKNWIDGSLYSEKVTMFQEEMVLGTGGALKNAETLLSERTFLLHNSDIISDINLEELLRHHIDSGNLVTLAVHDCPEFNTVYVDKNGFVKRVGKPDKPDPEKWKRLAYTGISLYEPGFLKLLPSGASSLVDGWLNAIEKGHKVGTFDVSGSYWNDIGTPARYAEAIFQMLKKEGEMIYLHPSVSGCGDADIDGYVVIEDGATLGRGALLKNTIILSGGMAEDDSECEDYILGHGFKIALGSPASGDDTRELIGTGGSDRTYYRIRKHGKTSVLMECPIDDPDFERHIEYTRFFHKHSIPVPALREIFHEKKIAVFEDLGDTSLYNWLKCKREEEEIEKIYKKILAMLVLLHNDATKDIAGLPALASRVFDYKHFRWETGYFVERFIKGLKKIKVYDTAALGKEFHDLAVRSDSFPKTVIHRDFQSQNIMVTKGGVPRLIDYQGARMGPPAYDIASMLWDPYYRLDDGLRERLLKYYIDGMKTADAKFDVNIFKTSLNYSRLQRHMQALGAYGFLSVVKGKKYFLKHVPECVRLLKEDIELFEDEFPALYKLVNNL
ncbi:MAG: sugar phosphate nucleotidyltransferase [Thermodesulfovibrionia bacterium]|nr:sugar phosphate nucleotidyltransferase [Thermodesulfovibrionia bacterium]